MNSRRVVVGCGRSLVVVSLLGISVGLTSCKDAPKGGSRHPTIPVQGEVFVNGKPGVKVLVTLVPDEAIKPLSTGQTTISPSGMADEEGVFHISTYETKDGAPAGTYKIRVTKLELPPGFSKGAELIDKLGGKFADAEKNAGKDAEHFTVNVQATSDGSPVIIPKIEITHQGFDDQFKVP